MRIEIGDQPTSMLSDAWRACVGTGRMNLALRRDYQESLALVQEEIGFRYVRGHGLLSDDMGVYRPYEHDGERRHLHSFTYVDQVVDAYLEQGIRPFLELGFMPAALASGDQTVFWWQGNVTPPRDHREWADLVRGVVDNPDDVNVTSRSLRRGELLEVRVNPEDLGRVIGRQGRTARALRTVISALSTRGPVRVDVVDTDRR